MNTADRVKAGFKELEENGMSDLAWYGFISSADVRTLLREYETLENRNKILRESLLEAIEYLEPRLANKSGSRGLTIVLPRLREALKEKK